MKHAILAIMLSACGLIAADKPADAKPYPLDKCIVSDEKLGAEGKPVVFVHEGQEIKLCCQDCRKDFDANPAKYLAKLPGLPQGLRRQPGQVPGQAAQGRLQAGRRGAQDVRLLRRRRQAGGSGEAP